MEHRIVRGVGRVGPIDAAQRDDPHRRRRASPSRESAPCSSGCATAAGRCRRAGRAGAATPAGRRDRNSPADRGPDASAGMFSASKLCHSSSISGPVGHREAEPAHDLLQLLDRLRDRMKMAEPRPRAGQRRIEGRACRWRHRRCANRCLGRGEGGFELLLDLVESLAGGRLVGRRQRRRALFAPLSAGRFWRRGIRPAPLRAPLDPPRRRAPRCPRRPVHRAR